MNTKIDPNFVLEWEAFVLSQSLMSWVMYSSIWVFFWFAWVCSGVFTTIRDHLWVPLITEDSVIQRQISQRLLEAKSSTIKLRGMCLSLTEVLTQAWTSTMTKARVQLQIVKVYQNNHILLRQAILSEVSGVFMGVNLYKW